MQKSEKLLYLAVLSQSLIDELDDNIGVFRQKHKQLAKMFLNQHMEIMNQDFQSSEAVDQLINLSQWIKDLFMINIKVGTFEESKQKNFESEWQNLLIKYGLEIQ